MKKSLNTKSLTTQLNKLSTKSSQIRFLDSKNFTRSEISTILTKHHNKLVRYQHVRNVLITPITKQK